MRTLDKQVYSLSEDLETYRKWKEGAAKNGCTPLDLVNRYERMGMADYANQLREVIEKMEAAL